MLLTLQLTRRLANRPKAPRRKPILFGLLACSPCELSGRAPAAPSDDVQLRAFAGLRVGDRKPETGSQTGSRKMKFLCNLLNEGYIEEASNCRDHSVNTPGCIKNAFSRDGLSFPVYIVPIHAHHDLC